MTKTKTKPKPKSKATKMDKVIGNRIYEFRLSLGLSRKDIAKQIDVTHQQFGKYETGENRIPTVKFHQVAIILLIDPSQLVEGIDFFGENKAPKNQDFRLQRLRIETHKNLSLLKNKHKVLANNFIRDLAKS